MLKAEKNAKVIGYILFILNLIDLISALSTASEFEGSAVALSLIGSIGGLVVGYGLIKTKVWSIYGVGALAVYRLLLIFYNSSVGFSPTTGVLIMFAINVLLFFWFLSAKSKFKK